MGWLLCLAGSPEREWKLLRKWCPSTTRVDTYVQKQIPKSSSRMYVHSHTWWGSVILNTDARWGFPGVEEMVLCCTPTVTIALGASELFILKCSPQSKAWSFPHCIGSCQYKVSVNGGEWTLCSLELRLHPILSCVKFSFSLLSYRSADIPVLSGF